MSRFLPHFSSLRLAVSCLVLGYMGTPTLLADLSVEAKQDGVKVLKEAAKDSAEIATLNKGEAVEAMDRKGMFWRVKVKGQEGYVSFMAVSRKEGGTSALATAINKSAQESRDMDGVKGARSRSAVMGIRGLDESSETSSAGNVAPNLRLVYQMEDRSVSQKRLDKLGEMVMDETQARTNKAAVK